MTSSTSFDLNFYVGREENLFWEIFLTFFSFVLKSFQGGIIFFGMAGYAVDLRWTYPPLIYGLPTNRNKKPKEAAI